MIPEAPPDNVAVYVVDVASGALGCRVAVDPLADTDAATVAPSASRSTNVLDVTLDAAIGSLKVAIRSVVVATSVAPDGGDTLATVGGVVSAVVNDQV
jgi:hypothetical protein